MANRKSASQDVNVAAVLLLNKATDSKPVKGEDLFNDPKLRKAYAALKKRAKKKTR